MIELNVYIGNELVGRLFRISDHNYLFRYLTQNPEAFVSLTMPLRVEDYETQVLHPIFQMNLPEGYNLELLRNKFAKVITFNDMSLLSLVGANQIGRLTLLPKDRSPTDAGRERLTFDDRKLLGRQGTLELFEALVQQYSQDFGISGVHPKFSLSSLDRAPKKRALLQTPTHIYKSSKDYRGLAVNEYFCLRAMSYAKIEVPEMRLSENGDVLRVERFDVKDGRRLGFEEAVVLRGLSREGKYDGSYERMINNLLVFIPPSGRLEASRLLFRMLTMHFMLRNGDAHLKNFGLVYSGFDDARLASAYDVVCTRVHIPKDVMALTLDGSKEFPTEEKLIAFGQQTMSISPSQSRQIIRECADAVYLAVKDMREYCRSNKKHAELLKFMERHLTDGVQSLCDGKIIDRPGIPRPRVRG